MLTERNLYVRGQALSRSVHLATQVVGAVIGGVLVGWLSPSWALAVDCVSFLLSALLVALFVRRRPAPDPEKTSPRRAFHDAVDGGRELFGDPVRRAITLLGWGAGLFLVAPEAVALAYRANLQPWLGGVLLAAVPAGAAVGALLMPRLPMRDQLRLLLPLAALSALPLFATSIDPPPLVAAALWFRGWVPAGVRADGHLCRHALHSPAPAGAGHGRRGRRLQRRVRRVVRGGRVVGEPVGHRPRPSGVAGRCGRADPGGCAAGRVAVGRDRARRLSRQPSMGMRRLLVPERSSHADVGVRTTRSSTASQPGQRATRPGARL